jgi:cell division protein FtsZ
MGVRGVTDLMMSPGLVNLDFADIRTVMAEMGKAMMGTGEAEGEGRAIRAAEAAINNPLLEDTNMSGARGLLINITGGEDMTLFEVDEAANRIREEVAEDANIIFGSAIDEQLSGRVRVSVVATGIDSQMPARVDPPQPGNAERPRLVAVGNGAPVSAVAGPQQGGSGFTPGMAPSVAPVHAEPVFSSTVAPLPGRPALVEPMGEVMPTMIQHGMAQPMQHAMTQPERAPAPVARPAETRPHMAARSLFGVVTGAFRRQSAAPLPAEPPRSEPQFEAEPVTTQRPADEMGLDIPAFLRRQQ